MLSMKMMNRAKNRTLWNISNYDLQDQLPLAILDDFEEAIE